MIDHKNIDDRMEAALKEDAAAVGSASSEVPASLRSLIARTPSATSAASVGAASTVAKFAATKLTLWSAGGLLVVAAGFFAIASNDPTPINSQPEPTLTPMTVTVDTPKPVVDSVAPRLQQQAKQTPTSRSTPTYTQAQIDSMLLAMPEVKGTVHERDSIRATMKRRK